MQDCLRCGINNQSFECSSCNRILDKSTLEELKSIYNKLESYFKSNKDFQKIDIKQINAPITQEQANFLYHNGTHFFEVDHKTKVTWNEIRFEDGEIIITLPLYNGSGVRYKFEPSRKYFNFLKQLFIEHNEDTISITYNLKNHQATKVEDFEGKFRKIVKVIDIKLPSSFRRKLISINKPIYKHSEKVASWEVLRLNEKEEYLNFLIDIQSKHLPTVFITEPKYEVVSFLFTWEVKNRSQTKNFRILIWESNQPNTATHIFKCYDFQYDALLKTLEEFLSNNSNTRSYLHAINHVFNPLLLFNKNQLHYYKALNHDTFESWHAKLKSIKRDLFDWP